MANIDFRQYAQDNGGRVVVLFLLFLLALYQFHHAGFNAFAIVCLIPVYIFVTVAIFRYRMLVFWSLVTINYFVAWKEFPSTGVPLSLFNEAQEMLLLVLAIIDIQGTRFERVGNVMFATLLVWCGFCTLEVLNDTCDIGIDIGRWYTAARSMAFQIMYAYLVFTLYLSTPKLTLRYLTLWAYLALFSSIWTWKQVYIGFSPAEERFIQGAGRSTHIIQGGTLIRYFSTYTDAANFGIGIASTAVAFIIFGITSKINKYRILFTITGLACAWAMFQSGTRTGMACFMAGMVVYIFLSKSIKVAVPFTIVLFLFIGMLAFTNIGQGNQQIRRMRTVFDKNDASAKARNNNQEAMKKYMKDAPWGIGMAVGPKNVPANNKFTIMAQVPPDSEYVFIWIHTGVIGITIFLICTFFMLAGACWIVFFTLKSPSLRGIGAGMCCAFVSQQLGGYGNQVLLQFPNCLIFYGGLTIVYILPHIEQEWIEYEAQLLAKQEEKKRLKLEKKRASRV